MQKYHSIRMWFTSTYNYKIATEIRDTFSPLVILTFSFKTIQSNF